MRQRTAAVVYGTAGQGCWNSVREGLLDARALPRRRGSWRGGVGQVALGVAFLAGWLLTGEHWLLPLAAAMLLWGLCAGAQVGPWRRRRGFSENEAEAMVFDVRRHRCSIEDTLPAPVRPAAFGALGEERVGRELEKLGSGWQVAHDVLLSGAPSPIRANADHLVAGPGTGVIMVDAKSWRGELSCSRGRNHFTVSGPGITGSDRRIRKDAAATLRAEAAAVSSGGSPVEVIVVAVTGRGTIAGGEVWLSGRGREPSIVAVRVEDLLSMLERHRHPHQPTVSLHEVLVRLRAPVERTH